jgi:hypothetical protein
MQYNRFLFLLQVSTRHIKDKEFGLLPTPTCSDALGSGGREALIKRGRKATNDLASWAAINSKDGKNAQLSPLFVGEMMGFPENWTTSPFLNGEKNQSKLTETQ